MKNKINIFPTLLTNIILFAVLMLLILKIMNIDNKNMLLIENFSDFINICQDKVPQFYISGGDYKGAKSIYECGEDCSTNDCNFFTHDSSNNYCYIYNNNVDVSVNCAANSSRIIPNLSSIYKGQGFVKKNYYKLNKDKFKHYDYLLEQATAIKDEYMEIKSKGKQGEAPDPNIWDDYNDLATNINNYLKLPTSKFYSYLNPHIDDETVDNTKMQFMGEDISLIPLLKLMENEEQSLDNLESKYSNQNVKFDRQYLIYTILFFIMILTTIVLIIFKIYPNIISLKFIIFYFLGISAMLVFLQMFLKI